MPQITPYSGPAFRPGARALIAAPQQATGHRSRSLLDSVGGTLSFACALHCVALPFIITLLPLIGLSFLAHSLFELIMIGIALTLATASFCWGVRIHGQWKLLLFIAAAAALFASGMSLLDHSILSGDGHSHTSTLLLGDISALHFSSETLHWVLMGIGGLTLALGHFLNDRLCRSCSSCTTHTHEGEGPHVHGSHCRH